MYRTEITVKATTNGAPTAAPPLPRLRPYQCEAGRAVLTSVRERRGHTVTVEIARQGGKNELSAQIEMFLLAAAMARGGDAIKCAPTFRPQLRISMRRLWFRCTQARIDRALHRDANSVSIGRARELFLSAEPNANVVGHTASLLLEVDEAQGVDIGKYEKEFLPMAATANATVVLYGTAWDDRTLLERQKQANLEAERRDGVRRHFQYDWREVARHNPRYGDFVERERARLGETHPVYLTQYCLEPIAGGGRLFNAAQRALLTGVHERLRAPVAGEQYAAGLDLAGGDDESPGRSARRDATVLTIGRLLYSHEGDAQRAAVSEPRVEIVEHVAWTGEPHERLLPQIIALLRDTWRVQRVAVDATGLGETIARLLTAALGGARVEAVKFTSESKSRLGFDLLAAVNGGRLKSYRDDGSPEHREFARECEAARATYRANQTMNFFVDENDGHDDYVVSAALLVRASRDCTRRAAAGRVRAEAW
jgi:hypothetical protein